MFPNPFALALNLTGWCDPYHRINALSGKHLIMRGLLLLACVIAGMYVLAATPYQTHSTGSIPFDVVLCGLFPFVFGGLVCGVLLRIWDGVFKTWEGEPS